MSKYTIEGKVTLQDNPEKFLGHYGLEATYPTPEKIVDGVLMRGTTTKTVRSDMKEYLEAVKEIEKLPESTQIYQIETLEQARRFASQENASVYLERSEKPQSWNEIFQLILAEKPESEILSAVLQVWKEVRLPASWLYFYAKGELLDEIEYSQENGAQRNYSKIEGERTVKGARLVTPRLSLSRLTTNSKVRRYSRW